MVDLLANNEIMPNLFLACYLFLIGANPIGGMRFRFVK